ncbi:Tyrosine-protein kinase [Meloidogyne graminicola]|uniref:Tyrosine-protein kinase n=1 Tax=Meloidogyne graminicola TaxID=189291 RepID=A0A8S9ZXI6_9BILA|nr:Tyrosine-protein kinase [Meloidogyne graminicola]
MGAKYSINRNNKEDHTKFPFWCGYLPDADALDILNNKNEFILRCLPNDSLSLTLYDGHDKLSNFVLHKDKSAWHLEGQKSSERTSKELIEFYWCTKQAIMLKGECYRLEFPIFRPVWLLSSAKVCFGDRLGEGAFGIVYRGELVDEGTVVDVAIKQLVGKKVKQEQLDNLWKEARIMTTLRNENVVRFYGIVNDSKPFSIVLEYINGPSVQTFLQEDGENSSDKMRTKIMIGAARGMKYLHLQKPPFLHLDLATRNLLIHWTGRLKRINNMNTKVADFGLSKRCQRATIDTSKPTNLRWMDPDSFNMSTVDKFTDVYAFGVTLFECFSRPYEIPYSKWSAQKVYEELIQPTTKRKRLNRPDGMPAEIDNLMASCMRFDRDRENRPSFEDIERTLTNIYQRM